MKLAARITAVLVLGTLLLMVIAEYITVRRENEEMDREMRVDAGRLAATISSIVDDLWELGGRARALQAVREINGLRETTSVRLVYFDLAPGDPDGPSNTASPRSFVGDVYSEDFYDGGGQLHLCTFSRLTVETRPAAIELAEPVQHINRNSSYFAMHAAVLTASTALLGAVMAVIIGGTWVARPLRRLIEKTRRIGDGDLSGPLKMERRDEFGELAAAINSMCEQLQKAQRKIAREAEARSAALDQLRHADRLRTVGRLAAGIAHELGTPLNVVSGRAGLIASGRLSAEEVRNSAVTIKSESDRIATIIRQLLDFARRNTPQRKAVDLCELTRRTIELLTPIADKHGCSLQVVTAMSSLTLHVDAGQIQQVLTNLIVNAVESMPSGGPVEIKISREHAQPPEGSECAAGEFLRLDVCDRGEGISPEIMDQIFEPFFTTKDVGRGTGLGLSIAYGIVQEHGGWIGVSSELGKGSCFSMYLPIEVAPCMDES